MRVIQGSERERESLPSGGCHTECTRTLTHCFLTQDSQSDRSAIPYYMQKSKIYPPCFPHEMGACNEVKSQLKALYEAERKRLEDEGAKK